MNIYLDYNILKDAGGDLIIEDDNNNKIRIDVQDFDDFFENIEKIHNLIKSIGENCNIKKILKKEHKKITKELEEIRKKAAEHGLSISDEIDKTGGVSIEDKEEEDEKYF